MSVAEGDGVATADAPGPSGFDWLSPLQRRGIRVPGLVRPLEVVWSVPKTPDGDLSVTVRFEPAAGEGTEAPVDVVELTATAAVAAKLSTGEVTPNAAWMSGRLKASGPTGPLLALLAHSQRRA